MRTKQAGEPGEMEFRLAPSQFKNMKRVQARRAKTLLGWRSVGWAIRQEGRPKTELTISKAYLKPGGDPVRMVESNREALAVAKELVAPW